MNGLWKQCYCLSEKPSSKAIPVLRFCTEEKGWVSTLLSLGNPGRCPPAAPLEESCSHGAAPANPPSQKGTRNTNGISNAITRCLGELSGTLMNHIHRHLDRAPWELKSKKATSFCSMVSKDLEADISLGQGPVSLTFLLQTPSLFGSYIWCFRMWHNNNNTSGVKKASTDSSTKPQLWENCAGFSFGRYK